MTTQKSFKFLTVSVSALIIALFFITATRVSADDGEDHSDDAAATTSEEATAETTAEEAPAIQSYEYIAQPGDSYSLMARKAVQTSGFETSTNLTEAQIIYVEANLTALAGSPELNLGEKVSISKDLVKQWSEKAKELTNAQQAMWQVYADSADFNTNSVGESRE